MIYLFFLRVGGLTSQIYIFYIFKTFTNTDFSWVVNQKVFLLMLQISDLSWYEREKAVKTLKKSLLSGDIISCPALGHHSFHTEVFPRLSAVHIQTLNCSSYPDLRVVDPTRSFQYNENFVHQISYRILVAVCISVLDNNSSASYREKYFLAAELVQVSLRTNLIAWNDMWREVEGIGFVQPNRGDQITVL